MIHDRIFYDSKSLEGKIEEFKVDIVEHSHFFYKEQKYKPDNKNYSRREPSPISTSKLLQSITSTDHIKISKEYKGRIYHEDKFSVVLMKDWYFLWCELLPQQEEQLINKYELKIHEAFK